MAERQRSGVLIHILAPKQLEAKPEQPLPEHILLRNGEYKTFHALPNPKGLKSTIVSPKSSELSFTASENHVSAMGINNYADANFLQKLAWAKPDITPQGHTELLNPVMHMLWEMYYGENPLQGTKETFGHGPELIEVEFLGHPDELLIDIMSAQAEQYSPELVVHYPLTEKATKQNAFNRVVLKTSPVMPVTVQHEWYDRKARKQHPYQYSADAMLFLELFRRDNTKEDKHEITYRKIASRLRIGLALQDELEHKLRVYHSNWVSIEQPKKKKRYKKDAEPDVVEEPEIDLRTVALSQLVSKLYELSARASASGEVTVRDVQYSAEHPEASQEVLAVVSQEVSALRKLLSTRKKVVKKPQVK